MPPFSPIGNVIKGAASIAAILPGIALAISAIELPMGMQRLIGGLAVTTSALIVICTHLFRSKLVKISAHRFALGALTLALIGIVCTVFTYSFVGGHTVKEYDSEKKLKIYVTPINPQGELKEILVRYDNDYIEALHHPIIGSRLKSELHQQSEMALWSITSLVLISHFLLTTAVVLGAWRFAEILRRRKRKN